MGRGKLQSEMKVVEGERADCDAYPNKATIVCMVNSEIGTVLAVMRRNVRWGGRYMSGDDQLEHSLIQSFKALRKEIFTWKHRWNTINPSLYLQPFLDVIQLDETSAPITGVALSSVYKILTLDVIDQNTVNVNEAMHLLVDAVTSCRFEVTDPASEEVVLMKILQVLLACMKSKASPTLSNHHVWTIVNTCFRIVHQAGTKGELLQRMARHTMHELLRCIFLHLPDVGNSEEALVNGTSIINQESSVLNSEHAVETKRLENGNAASENGGQSLSTNLAASVSLGSATSGADDGVVGTAEDGVIHENHDSQPYGVPCMVEIFHFLCSLLNIAEQSGLDSRSNTIAFDEDMPLFALGLINSTIELAGPSIRDHPKLLAIIRDELFRNLMQFGLSMSPLILSMVCSIVLFLYHHMRSELKLQIEAFFSCVLLRLAQSRHGASYQQQEVAMEALVDFCRQTTFVLEMFANYDCDITCSNVFEELTNLFSRSAFPVNSQLSSTHVLALDGLIAVIEGVAERLGNVSACPEQNQADLEEYSPFWLAKCDDYSDPDHWVPFVRWRKFIKKKLMVGADHFNQDPKKGLEFLQGTHLLPKELDPKSVACFLRYTCGLDKNVIGELLGNHDPFYIQVLHEFAQTFDFQDMNLDNALRLFLETFRLPGESQKIQRVLEAFSERYYEQSPQILANKDAALLLSYSMILLNTDLHNAQVKKKMTEEDFIRNNRLINGGRDLPREFLSELYYSIGKNEIRMVPDQGAGLPQMNSSRWLDLVHRSNYTEPFIVPDSRSYLDHDMFTIIAGPSIAAISVVLDHAEQEDVYETCIDGFLAVAKISACHHLDDVLDDLVVSLCKFTTLLNPTTFDEPVLAFADDAKARMATVAVFTIANTYGDYIRSGWKNILDCILRLNKLSLLPANVAGDSAEESQLSADNGNGKAVTKSLSSGQMTAPKKSYGLMGRFSQFLSLDTEEPISQPTEEEIVARKICVETVQECRIDNIFKESKFLQAESLLQLSRALISASELAQKEGSPLEDVDAVFCLGLLIETTLNNRDRIVLVWQSVYEHIYDIVQSTFMPCALVEKAVFGLLRICQRLLPYKENLVDELLRSLQLVLKLDARVADAYCEQITQEVGRLVKANATHIRSQAGWRSITSLLSTTARHPEAAEPGFDTLLFIMSDGAHLLPANYALCVDAARQFAESRVGLVDRSILSLDLMASSADCLSRWASEAREAAREEEEATRMCQDIREMWLRLLQGLRKVCLDQREEVRVHALLSLQKCLRGVEGIDIPYGLWAQCFDSVIFTLLDDLLEIVQGKSIKDYRDMEGTLVIALKILPKVFLQLLPGVSQSTEFSKLWSGVLSRTENYFKVKLRGKKSKTLEELIPEMLKNMLLVMKTGGVLGTTGSMGGESLWELTWLHVNKFSPSLQSEVFPDQSSEQSNSGETLLDGSSGGA